MVAGCVRDGLVPCGELLCPVDTVCTLGGCAQPADVAACEGRVDGDACVQGALPGTCSGESCHEAVCGNAIVDLAYGELCDDGNQTFDDGCSADCRSLETCGNDVVDVIRDEECDRGVAGLASDGCSSLCTFETELWREVTPGPMPVGPAVMTYDEARGVAVLFGRDPTRTLAETWEYDGVSWIRRTPVRTPGPRVRHMMTYDSVRQRVVLFGGSSTNVYNDTWEWDGVTWTERVLPVMPPARSDGSLSYDPERQVSVLYGGFSGIQYFDTWEYNGTTWEERTPVSPAPSPQAANAAIAFDPILKRTLLFGGSVAGVGQTTETWSWDGVRWQRLAVASPVPAPRINHAMVTDWVHRRIVMVGGSQAGVASSEAWAWSGTAWSALGVAPVARTDHGLSFDRARDRVVMFAGINAVGVAAEGTYEMSFPSSWIPTTPALSPGPRSGYVLVYDPRRGTTLLFGGCLPDFDADDETWLWDGVSWSLRRPALRPGPRCDAAATYHAPRGEVIVFGGSSGASSNAETWVWDGDGWSRITTASPSARSNAAMAYDVKRERVVLFGGEGSTYFDDTWEWNGTAWTRITPPASPRGRAGHSMVYDPVREKIVLYGGAEGLTLLGDHWEWDGTVWTERVTTMNPGQRTQHAMTFDPIRRRIVLIGGFTAGFAITNVVWEWDGVAWSARTPAIVPSGRTGAELAFDTIRRRTVIFSGAGEEPDTWLRGFEAGGVEIERCLDPADDDDGDGLRGCADPDCLGRCAPLCIPGLPCDPALPRCGDLVCGSVEDYVLCPSDCSPQP